jgi:hypothetical protein
MSETRFDFDSPWKIALEQYFEPFMAFFFPQAHADIDWDRGYEFCDKELQQVVRDAELGRRWVDKLVKLYRRDGEETWILVHIEIQSQEESLFPRRMFVYNYRLFDRYKRVVVSLAILGDERSTWRPDRFGYQLWGCQVGFQFPIVKLLDYKQQWEMLETSDNPFATVVMAHLKAQETRYDESDRKSWKLYLTRRLYEKGYQREDILNLFRVIDWMIQLPQELEQEFWQAIEQYETEKRMPYITSVERMGIAQGTIKGRREAIIEVLETRFGTVPQTIFTQLEQMTDIDTLKTLLRQAIAVQDLDEFHRMAESLLPSGKASNGTGNGSENGN